ncbi:MAG TPA: trehalose-6-phosphate synthase [Acetobacteraceae bacterium]|nr:trehalose-6-phosphate synthase [Acetobacteraceae bacterium]
MARLVIVSNRVPAPFERGPRAGGLEVALADALRPGSLWLGWSGRRNAKPADTPEMAQADGITYATVDMTEAEYRAYYVGFANGALWPLLHFRLGLMTYRREDFQGYCAVNRRFAAALAKVLQPDDLIWVHDYHLIPLAQELRLLGVRNRVGFFLHIPFVPPVMLEVLPCARELLEGLAAYDVVGFHTEAYRLAFLQCVRQLLGVAPRHNSFVHNGAKVDAIVDPIGIDTETFAKDALRVAHGAESRRLRDSMGDRALAIGVDRLDYSKGLPNRLIGFGRLLATYPEHRRKVNFLQVAARSREDNSDYQQIRRELDRIAGNINGSYSEFDWIPLRYITRALSRSTLAGFYRIARVGVVTPLRDGMNLVAKEFIAAQNGSDPGMLVLSRFAGAAEELTEALIVNPFDPDEIAAAVHRALTMELEERRARQKTLLEKVHRSNARRYCEVFLRHLMANERDQSVAAVVRMIAG